ncbi:hypothetical protein TIFTF001_021652 [Ficus carica]|uniref:Uncharacterized protein n=1 Tax=Ficus carica TaxID=3494 RepID=A0AA88AIE0_FICCA|nr:hypothetical protein TIFTF001_021652 [Ficus carica]
MTKKIDIKRWGHESEVAWHWAGVISRDEVARDGRLGAVDLGLRQGELDGVGLAVTWLDLLQIRVGQLVGDEFGHATVGTRRARLGVATQNDNRFEMARVIFDRSCVVFVFI